MRREFVLELRGVIDDPDGDLSESNLRLNLEWIAQNAMSNGVITGDTSAVVDEYGSVISIKDIR